LSQIYHARIYSSDHQAQMISKAESLCKTRNVRLIVVDSLMALMRAEYVGIGMLARRQSALNNMLHALSRVAETYNAAVLVTNQVATKMMGMFSADDAIGGNIVAHGCHFRVMFKTKGFSSNNSLKRRAIIVDAPDLPPNECEFYITSMGIADTEITEIPSKVPSKFDIEEVFEEIDQTSSKESQDSEISITEVKGIGKGTAKSLESEGILSIKNLIDCNPEEISTRISGISPKMINEWQDHAKKLLK